MVKLVQDESTEENPDWDDLEDAAPNCPRCSRAPFQFAMITNEEDILYGCKCGHEWFGSPI